MQQFAIVLTSLARLRGDAQAQPGPSPYDVAGYRALGGAPVALVVKSGSMTWAAYVTPAFGWGRVSPTGAASVSGTRFMMGGGLGVTHANGWGLSLGMQKIFIDQGKTAFGLNVSYGI